MIPDEIQAALDTLRIALMKKDDIPNGLKLKLHRDLQDIEQKLVSNYLGLDKLCQGVNNLR